MELHGVAHSLGFVVFIPQTRFQLLLLSFIYPKIMTSSFIMCFSSTGNQSYTTCKVDGATPMYYHGPELSHLFGVASHLLPPQRKVHFHLPTPPSADPSGCPVLLHSHRCGICEESVVILPQVAMVLLRVDLPFLWVKSSKTSPKIWVIWVYILISIYIYTYTLQEQGNISHQTGKGKTSTQKCWLAGADHWWSFPGEEFV